jgi:hypothetical protein
VARFATKLLTKIFGITKFKMEKKKLKEIEARLSQLLREDKKVQDVEAPAPRRQVRGVEVIRRRKGHRDLHIA